MSSEQSKFDDVSGVNSEQSQFDDASRTAPTQGGATPGAILRLEREAQGHSMGDVALAIRLSQRQIALLESDAWDQLPGETFVRGFLRNYARFLRIDPEPLLAQVATAPEKPIELHEGLNDEVPFETGSGSQTLPMLIGGALLLVAAVAVYYLWPLEPLSEPARVSAEPGAAAQVAGVAAAPAVSSAMPASDNAERPADSTAAGAATVTPPPVEQQAAAAAAKPSAAAASPPAGKEAAADSEGAAPEARPWVHVEGPERTLRFSVHELAWIKVLDAGGNTLIAYNFEPGMVRTVRGVAPLDVVVGNVAGVEVTVDGDVFDLGSRARSNVARVTVE